MPTEDISIGQLSKTEKVLEFTHITWDAGAGLLEIRPSYNPITGISQGFQALYTSPSPGHWTFDKLMPIVGPMIWQLAQRLSLPARHLRALHGGGPGGGLGTLEQLNEVPRTT